MSTAGSIRRSRTRWFNRAGPGEKKQSGSAGHLQDEGWRTRTGIPHTMFVQCCGGRPHVPHDDNAPSFRSPESQRIAHIFLSVSMQLTGDIGGCCRRDPTVAKDVTLWSPWIWFKQFNEWFFFVFLFFCSSIFFKLRAGCPEKKVSFTDPLSLYFVFLRHRRTHFYISVF